MKARLIALSLFASLIFFAFCGAAWAGYSTTQLTNSSSVWGRPDINNAGQVVWNAAYPGDDGLFYGGLYLYDGGNTAEIISHSFSEYKINNSGQIVAEGPGIWLFSGGVWTEISGYYSNPAHGCMDAQINDNGQIVYDCYNGGDWEVYLYRDGITSRLDSGSSPQINNAGQVVWQRNGIHFYSGGITIALSTNGGHPQMNDAGQIVWTGADGVYLYSGGDIALIGRAAYGPQINNAGQVVFSSWLRWRTVGMDELLLYSGGITRRLGFTINNPNTSLNELNWQINDSGQVIWNSYDVTDYEIYLYSEGVTAQITNNANDDRYPGINNEGQIVWDESDGSNYETFLSSPSSCIDGRPSLTLNRGNISWASYADYLASELSVTMTVINLSTVSTGQVQIIGSINTSGATLSTAVPALVGDIAGGASGTVVLKYHVPTGVGAFMTTVYATAQDSCGTTYSYPGPYPGL